jgi:NitT/TauT family transport system permease protein
LQHHAEVLGHALHRPNLNWRDLAALALIVAVILGAGARQMLEPFAAAQPPEISLAPASLPNYALRTTLRMLLALSASFVFTFTYGTLAAKSRRAEMLLIPLLDVLQSVPVLGYLSFTLVFFVSLAPNRALGAELAAIFGIFTSQAWNMTFSFFQSLRTVPNDLDEASRGFRFSAWQRFWRVQVPFAMPGLIWNTMMSMSGGWFFVVASEAISVGSLNIALPGIGSYVALAIKQQDLTAVGWAILAMTVTIALYDQLLFRPLVAWATSFVTSKPPQPLCRVAGWSICSDIPTRCEPRVNRSGPRRTPSQARASHCHPCSARAADRRYLRVSSTPLGTVS